MRGALLAGVLLALSSACATPGAPRTQLREDAYARYYATTDGRTLRVEKDGTVLDVTCMPLDLVEGKALREIPQGFCPNGKFPELGRVEASGGGWDMSGYPVAAETGRCRPLLRAPSIEGDQEPRRHSCWNRLWEVPAALVAYPVGAALIIGGCTAPIWIPLLLL